MTSKYKIGRGQDGHLVIRPGGLEKRLPWVWIGGGILCLSLLMTLVFMVGEEDLVEATKAGEESVSSRPQTITTTLELPASKSTDKPVIETTQTATLRAVEPIIIEVQGTNSAAVESANPVVSSSEQAVTQVVNDEPAVTVHEQTVSNGDSLYTMVRKLGLNQGDMIEVTAGEGSILKRLHPGQKITFHASPDARIEKLIYRTDEINSYQFTRGDDGFDFEKIEETFDRETTSAHGVISSSLFIAGQDAGLPDKTIMELTEIFAWDVDFVLDIRRGDHFTVLYEELKKDGKLFRTGNILAAEFVNQGRSIRALRYTDTNGHSSYYAPNGSSMKKAFLRSPVNFSRISSHFDLSRKHPILHTIRAHKGVDYASPRGTPIKATGNGKVSFAGVKGGYGRTIEIRHGATYTTLYAHLSKFRKGIKTGKFVRQGDVIGYVGSSGLATGPHLHYEFQVRGVHRNPVTVELPKAAPIEASLKSDFIRQTQALVHELDRLSQVQLASRD